MGHVRGHDGLFYSTLLLLCHQTHYCKHHKHHPRDLPGRLSYVARQIDFHLAITSAGPRCRRRSTGTIFAFTAACATSRWPRLLHHYLRKIGRGLRRRSSANTTAASSPGLLHQHARELACSLGSVRLVARGRCDGDDAEHLRSAAAGVHDYESGSVGCETDDLALWEGYGGAACA
jgi:hypothetical protein